MDSRRGSGRTILSVIGPHSGCGKTTFLVHLLRRIPGLSCLKISPTHCRAEKDRLGRPSSAVCFYIEEPARLRRADTDTALYLSSGAVQVERLRHWDDGLSDGLVAALSCFPQEGSVVVESSSAVKHLSPVAVVLVLRPPIREMKPSTRDALPLVTDLMVNFSGSEASCLVEAEALRNEFPSLQPQYTWTADLLHRPPPDDLTTRLGGLLGPAR